MPAATQAREPSAAARQARVLSAVTRVGGFLKILNIEKKYF